MLIKFLTVNFSFCDKVFQFEREEAHFFLFIIIIHTCLCTFVISVVSYCRLKNLDSPRNKSLRRLTINGDIVPCRVTALYAVKHSQLSLSVFPSLLFFSTHSYFAFLFYSLSYHPRHFFLLSLGLALCVLSLFFFSPSRTHVFFFLSHSSPFLLSTICFPPLLIFSYGLLSPL